ncbi:MAG: DUF1592 domain-containing protein [Pirellulales bacterium]|nr:DUF1592 domain-containing protein [Pirellulales bacterium]
MAFVAIVAVVLSLGGQPTNAAEPQDKAPAPDNQAASFAKIDERYAETVRPLAQKFCRECHGPDLAEAELNLDAFASLADVRRQPKRWQKVLEMLASGQMPPEGAEMPTTDQRAALEQWVRDYLKLEARSQAGDPGPVVLRRLSNAEYTYTIRDLTGVPLDPAKEFPADSASGEGFTNTGNSLVMSPALLAKYLDAGKAIAEHAELLPDGFRFSLWTTRRDWTDDILARIRAIYRQHSDAAGASQVNLQGIVFDTNDGGRLPVEKYLAVTLDEREALRSGGKSIAAVAKEQGLNAKYLGILWEALNAPEGQNSVLLDALRTRWRAAGSDQAAELAAEIHRWQQALWRFTTIGQHIEQDGTTRSWQQAVVPLTSRQEIRVPLEVAPGAKEVSLYLVAGDAGDASSDEAVVWQQPRLVSAGRPDLPLRNVRDFVREMTARRTQMLASTAKALGAAAEAMQATDKVDIAALATKHGLDEASLAPWLDYLGIGGDAVARFDHFTNKQTSVGGYDFVRGWGPAETPSLVANSSDNAVRVPGNMQPHGVCVHPSPTLNVVVGWKCPTAGTFRIEGAVTHAHPECGNGVTWLLELRRGATRQQLAAGISHGGTPVAIGPIESLAVGAGDLVALLVGPRDGNHGCDLTDVKLTLKSAGDGAKEWSLTGDITPDVLAANPHADRFGNAGVWHFGSEPVNVADARGVVPAGSLLARWQAASNSKDQQELAAALQQLLADGPAADAAQTHPDVVLYRQLTSLGGPLLVRSWPLVAAAIKADSQNAAATENTFGLDPAMFGTLPDGSQFDADSLAVLTPSVIEVRLPAELAAGTDFVTTGTLASANSAAGSAQFQVLTSKPTATPLSPATAIVVGDGTPARARFEKSFEDFRKLFPIALCYTKIVPVDEVVTLTLFHREDEPLRQLMLSDDETRRLERLWDELHFVGQTALAQVNAYEQIVEFATQDRPDLVVVFKPMREPINAAAAAFRQRMIDAEPSQVDTLVAFASQAYRRPLTDFEAQELRGLYRRLREQELPHDEAFRFTLARVLIAPAFLYRLENAPAGDKQGPVSDWELASRLSYFLWSSQPDDELRTAAATGTLHQPDVLAAQARRMLGDARIRRLATEFACQWLHIYEFDALDEKSARHFPEFAELRGDMYEESIRFFTDAFQHDSSVLGLFDADHTFVNERLAKFYGIADITGPEWRRVDGVRQHGRGGILALATTLAKQSGASRTSPILRGNWICEVVLGEKLPKPPKNVPILPEDETATDGLTVRQLVARHTSDAKCSSCHRKIDPFGFALEGYDAIGRHRAVDLANRPVDTKTTLPDGQEIDGLAGLRGYLVETRRSEVLRQSCKKLLGYALGRETQLSDEPLLDEMQARLAAHDYRFSVAVETILQSPQFREIRGRDVAVADEP